MACSFHTFNASSITLVTPDTKSSSAMNKGRNCRLAFKAASLGDEVVDVSTFMLKTVFFNMG